DGLLTRLPFAALSTTAHVYTPFSQLHATINVSSLSEYFLLPPPSPSRQPRSSIAIFADPVFASDARENSPSEDGFRHWRSTLARLPYTAVEAANIARRFSDNESLVFLGSEASMSNLLAEKARSARVLHIATHGYAD